MKNHRQLFRKMIVFIADFCIFSLVALFFVLFEQAVLPRLFFVLFNFAILYCCIALFQLLFRTYDSLWRYAAHQEYFMLLLGVGCGALLYEVLHYSFHLIKLGTSIICAVAGMTALGMLAMRFLYRIYREKRTMHSDFAKSGTPVAIVGAGRAGVLLLNEFQNNQSSGFRPVCFFDDEPEKQKKRLGGVPVVGKLADIPERLKDSNVKHIFVAMPSQSGERIAEVLTFCHQVTGADVRVLPTQLANMPMANEPLHKRLRKVEIGDLLGRAQVDMASPAIGAFLSGKTILVSGGGGSIGSELCRQIAAIKPKKLIILDIYENNAYDIQQELRYHYGKDLDLHVLIATIRDPQRINEIFDQYQPQVVFHAAAHKHVPLMESCPQEAVRNNVFGTYNIAMAAHRTKVEKFVQVSTDKAVNPTNVMGATKRMCELVIQGIQAQSETSFSVVRFGNVLGSNGSVIPLFERQIAEGGPVTLTDKRITRFFMTIPEAVQLVLQSGAMAGKNQVFVLDMGKPTKILDLAENLIRLSGLEPYKDIEIKEIGLRPGEKLYEELLVGGQVLHTEHELIFVEEQLPITAEEVQLRMMGLQKALDARNDEKVIEALRKAVPTYQPPEVVNQQAINAQEVTAVLS